MKRAIIALAILVAVGIGAGVLYARRDRTEIQVTTAPVGRGDIIDTVGATGTLQAVTTVQVGSQVSGNIAWLGADFNSIVRTGQEIARLDPSLFDAQLKQTQANLIQARANLTRARSELERARVQLLDAQQKYARAQALATDKLIAQSDLDAAKIAVDTATAAVQSQQASVTQAEAAVTQSEASVNQAQVNRNHTVIVAPIDGIVTQRNVDVGQTVAASMQAPTLFIIAADLTKMQVNANIDEADVGRIRPGQNVTFRVDAYPTDTFQGTVTQVRLQPVVVQNVTTYGAVIDVPNRELKLKPGMTANVKIEIAKRINALRIPNAALRFRPTDEMFAALKQTPPTEMTPFANAGGGRGARGGFAGRGGNATPSSTPPASPPRSQATNPSASAPASPEPRRDAATAPSGRGGMNPERMLERFKTMSPEEQQQMLARIKKRGGDTSAFDAAMGPKPAARPAGSPQQAETIDALFAPLPPVESRGRAWVFANRELKPVALRLGISDGTYTELLSEELQENMEVVTGVTGLAPTRTLPQGGGGSGNPLMPGRGGRGPGR
jgi:HlyD family secretion protein